MSLLHWSPSARYIVPSEELLEIPPHHYLACVIDVAASIRLQNETMCTRDILSDLLSKKLSIWKWTYKHRLLLRSRWKQFLDVRKGYKSRESKIESSLWSVCGTDCPSTFPGPSFNPLDPYDEWQNINILCDSAPLGFILSLKDKVNNLTIWDFLVMIDLCYRYSKVRHVDYCKGSMKSSGKVC